MTKQVPGFLQDQFPEGVDQKENIHIEKKLYGAQSMKNIIDRSFSELSKPKKTKNVKQLFEMYREVFYEIPKKGTESHTTLMQDSLNFLQDYIDPKDEQIESLQDEIIELLQKIEDLENPEEHAYFKNGQVLAKGSGGTFYYMDKGKKRNIVGGRPGEVWKGLKASLGYNPDDDDFEKNIVIRVPRKIIEGIPSGPTLDMEDLGHGKPLTIKKIKAMIDPDGAWKANPDRYQSVEEYQVALENEIIEAWDLERNLEAVYDKYKHDERYEETEELRQEASDMRAEAYKELTKTRNQLAAFNKIYDAIENWDHVTIHGLENMYKDLTENDFERISHSDRSEFKGWEKGRGGIEELIRRKEGMYGEGRFWKEGGRGTELY